MKYAFSAIALALASFSALAQPFSPSIGDGGGTIDQQVIGDTNASADHTQSTANQIGNAANANGATITTGVDTRDQNTNNVSPTATGGAAIGNQSSNDNKSNANASNGPQTMGQANTGTVGNTTATTGPSTSNSGGNTLGGASSSTGAISNQNVASGGAGGKGGAGGQGGAASSTGTNTGINGQQQGIDRSGNSDNRNALTGGAQNSSQRTSAGNGAGAGAGSGNQTANTTRVDASDRSSTTYTSRAVAHAPIIHGAASAPLATATMVVQPGVCGPRHYAEMTPVTGTHHGLLWDSSVRQGNDYAVVPAASPFVMKDGYLIGHMIHEYVAVLGTSSSKSLSVQGYGSNQQGGGGGAATGGSHQQIVVRITIRECVMPTREPAVAAVIERPVIVEAKPIRE